MKNLSVFMVAGVVLVVSACKDSYSEDPKVLQYERVDPLIKVLREYKKLPAFDLEDEADRVRLRDHDDAILAKWGSRKRTGTQASGIPVFSPDYEWYYSDNSADTVAAPAAPADSATNWAWQNQKSLAINKSPDVLPGNIDKAGLNVESWMKIPDADLTFGASLTGIGIRNDDNNLQNCALYYRKFESDGLLGQVLGPVKENTSNLERTLSLVVESPLYRVAVGWGFGVHQNQPRYLVIYYAPYNPATNSIEIMDPSDVIMLYRKQDSGAPDPERLVRTFDVLNTMAMVKKKHIVGIGGGVHQGNANRIAIRLGTVMN